MKLRTAVSAAFAAAALSSAAASAQEITLKVHHFLPPPSPAHARLITPWCDKITKESAGKLKCQIFPSMSMGGSPPQLYDQAKDGVADIVWTLPGYTANRFPTVEAFELPFMMSNPEATSRALWDYTQMHSKAEFKDVKPLFFHVHGPGVFHMREKQIRTLADFKGLKVRAPTRMTNRMIASLGATPVGMPVPQVPEALNKGVIDGTVIPWEVVPAIKVHELVKFHSETDPKFPAFYTSVFLFGMNLAKYNSLPADLKKVLDANSGAETSAWAGKVFGEADARGRQLSEERKNTLYTIPGTELVKWQKAAEPVQIDWIKEVNRRDLPGLKLVESAQTLIAKYTKK